jgi:hypothetical protein
MRKYIKPGPAGQKELLAALIRILSPTRPARCDPSKLDLRTARLDEFR